MLSTIDAVLARTSYFQLFEIQGDPTRAAILEVPGAIMELRGYLLDRIMPPVRRFLAAELLAPAG